MGDPVTTAFTVLGGVSKGIGAFQARQGAALQRSSLRTRRTQEKVAATQRSIRRIDNLSRVLSSNVARAGAGGIEITSPSFRSVQANDFNAFNEDEKADALNTKFRESFINQKISAATRNETSTLINLAGESLSQATQFSTGQSVFKSSLDGGTK